MLNNILPQYSFFIHLQTLFPTGLSNFCLTTIFTIFFFFSAHLHCPLYNPLEFQGFRPRLDAFIATAKFYFCFAQFRLL